MKYSLMLFLACSCFLLASCQEEPMNSVAPLLKTLNPSSQTIPNLNALPSESHSENGRAGSMPAYYDSTLFTINFKELPAAAEESVLAHNKSINVIYMSDNGLPNNQPFISVLDA